MKNSFKEFNRGRRSHKDEVHKGRPKTVVVPDNIDAVRELIMHDSHVTYREIEPCFGISPTNIHSIMLHYVLWIVKEENCTWPETKSSTPRI